MSDYLEPRVVAAQRKHDKAIKYITDKLEYGGKMTRQEISYFLWAALEDQIIGFATTKGMSRNHAKLAFFNFIDTMSFIGQMPGGKK